MADLSDEEEEKEASRARLQNMQAVDFNESMIEERAEEIAKIHSAVVQVNEMFRDIAVLVDDQSRDIGVCARV